MTGKLQKKQSTRRDAVDTARLKASGEPAHINPVEDRLLRELLPEYHGKVVKGGLLADAGRDGDDRVTLLAPKEQALLGLLGGSGTINPATGKLEFGDGMGGSDNPGGGHNGDQGPGGVGGPSGPGHGGVAGGGGYSGGPSSSPGGRGSVTEDQFGFSLFNSQLPSIQEAAGLGLRGYDPNTMASVESMLNTPNGYRAEGYENLSMMQYAPPNTLARLYQTYRYGPPPSYKALGAAPGRYGAPNARGPGMVGTAVANFGGPAMSAAMNLGMHMDMAMDPESRAASLAENQEQGAKNSTGQDRDSHTGLSFAELDARGVPGAASGSNTAGLLAQQTGVGGVGGTGTGTTAPGAMPTVQPGGMVTTGNNSDSHNTMTGLPLPVQNLLADYIWRGRQGSGFNW